MKIAIVGYGKMGKQIEHLALKQKREIVAIIDNEQDWKDQALSLSMADAAIEFSTPGTAFQNISRCLESGTPVVSGTTGWLEQYDEICQLCKRHDGAFLFASNFSLGMNIFFHLNKKLAEIMDRYDEYDVRIEETHHKQKIDKPSGTAIQLAEDILKINKRKNSWINKQSKEPENLGIISARQGNITGIHKVQYNSDFDELEIHHAAKNRQGFAHGALMATEWIKDKKGVFTFNDILQL